MEDVVCNSTKADQQTTVTEKYNDQFWTKILKDMPNFAHEHIEKHLMLEKDKTTDKNLTDALKHKKRGYRLFKAGYDKSSTEELQGWHVPKKLENKSAALALFEDLIFPQDSYEKDKQGKKRPVVQGKRKEYYSSNKKVSKSDFKNLKSG